MTQIYSGDEKSSSHIVELTLSLLLDERKDAIMEFFHEYSPLMRKAKGSETKHQAWEGGYLDHICECFRIAHRLYISLNTVRPINLNLESIFIVLFFHDVEKIWKYTTSETIDKKQYFTEVLPARGIKFSDEELNALTYIHGEGDDYGPQRVMNGLAAFCHAVDILSARLWFNEGKSVANEN